MIKFNSSRRRFKAMAHLSLWSMLLQIFLPSFTYAGSNTSEMEMTTIPMAPVAPNGGNYQGGVALDQMVNPFTGDFNYSLNLMNVEGFPISINYDANIGMHQEASWVGLGWSLNTGAINREMRGVPDDFDGDEIEKSMKFKEDLDNDNVFETSNELGIGSVFYQGSPEQLIGTNLGVELSNEWYRNAISGKGNEFTISPMVGVAASFLDSDNKLRLGLNLSGSLSIGSRNGIGASGGVNGFVGISPKDANNSMISSYDLGFGISSVNSTRGTKSLYQSVSLSAELGSIAKFGMSHIADISSGTKTYVPIPSNRINAEISSLGLKLGITSPMPNQPNWKLSPYAFYQNTRTDLEILDKTSKFRSFGYFNLQNAKTTDITDFNREKLGKVSEELPAIHSSQLTYDIFRVSGSSGGYSFRGHRNDVGTVTDADNLSTSNSSLNNITALIGFSGGSFQLKGTRLVYTNGSSTSTTTSGDFVALNGVESQTEDLLNFKDISLLDGESENYYLKTIGEKTVFDHTLTDQYGGEEAVSLNFTSDASDKVISLLPKMTLNTADFNIPSQNFNLEKSNRNTIYSTLNVKETMAIGFEKELLDYVFIQDNDFSWIVNTPQILSRNESVGIPTTSHKKDHHISEISVASPNGGKGYYNIPSYSLFEKQVIFNADGGTSYLNRNQITYINTQDNTMSNAKGKDEFFQSVTTPAYAETFLLRGIASYDYEDRTGDGFTEDDFGSYVKLNHSRLYGPSDPFYWQSPHSANNQNINGGSPTSVANLLEGLKTLSDDDKATYSFGAKEMWYTQSVEGKNYIAVFYLEDRLDQYSVLPDESGYLDENKAGKLLKKIVLYNKEDLRQNGGDAEPIQTVNFEYDYSLCQNYDGNLEVFWDANGDGNTDNEGGKLTLKKITIDYSDSKLGSKTPYEFTYGGTNENYNPMSVDRWGVFKSNSGNLNDEFPYAIQDNLQRDKDVVTWSLSEINMPSSGKMNVYYESDDYSFVQDKEAMTMFPIKGLGNWEELQDYIANSSNPMPNFSNRQFRQGKEEPNDVIFFDVPASITPGDFVDVYLDELYVKFDKQVFYQMMVETYANENKYEMISGFFKLTDLGDFGYVPGTTIAYAKIQTEDVSDENNIYPVNPIQKDGWQFLRKEASRVIFPDGVTNPNGIDATAFFTGLNQALNSKKYVWKFKENEAFVRLIAPTTGKLGGGHRVSKITYTDNWSSMSGFSEQDFTYGVEYSYDLDGINTSGVSEYEPTIGNGENPFRQPIPYEIDLIKYPNDHLEYILPFCESHFPSPSLGYSKVTVKNIDHANVSINGSGISVYEYYTAKENPTETNATKLSKTILEPIVKSVFNVSEYSLLGLSQGFSITLNDMHGKIKKSSSFNKDGVEVSHSLYKYKSADELSKTVNAESGQVKEDCSLDVSEEVLGKEIDMVNDLLLMEQLVLSSNSSIGVSFPENILFFPVINASYRQVYNSYIVNSFTKTIRNYAILESVETYYLGSTVKEENLVYDRNTGATILSKSNNQYDSDVFYFSTPAHWANKGMGQQVKTFNNHFENQAVGTDGWMNIPSVVESQYFYPGDELMIVNGSTISKAWVLKLDNTLGMQLIDFDGNPLATITDCNIRVIQSGLANKQFQSISSYASLKNPLDGCLNTPERVLAASAVELSQEWQTSCDLNAGSEVSNETDVKPGSVINPFVKGILGNWRPVKSYVYQDERVNLATEDARISGYFNSYTPFYSYGTPEWIPISNSSSTAPWLYTGTITEFNKNGTPVESKDLLNRSMGVIYGYNNNTKNLPIAMASNARVGDIGFDGFEDYSYLDQNNSITFGHFDFKNTVTNQLTQDESHTGKYSLKLNPGESIGNVRGVQPYAENCDDPYTDDGFVLRKCQCEETFNPQSGKYIFGAWVKQNLVDLIAYTDAQVSVKVYDTQGGLLLNLLNSLTTTENTIDGWQRFEFEFDIPSGGYEIKFDLIHSGASTNVPLYFDDIRVHPFNSTMVTSVYDPLTLRKWADLDDFNFATFYEYDEQGMMVRVKQETYEGIKTISEVRGSTVKNP